MWHKSYLRREMSTASLLGSVPEEKVARKMKRPDCSGQEATVTRKHSECFLARSSLLAGLPVVSFFSQNQNGGSQSKLLPQDEDGQTSQRQPDSLSEDRQAPSRPHSSAIINSQ